MSKRVDLTGQRFGMLTVIKMVYNEKKKNYSHCECLCDCGKMILKASYYLRHAKQIPSCGCNNAEYLRQRFAKDVDGMKFGKLTIIKTLWGEIPKVECVCDCGEKLVLRRNDVITGHTKSCGCLQKERMREIRKQDDTGYVSDFGVKIIAPFKRNEKGQLIWKCQCVCGNDFYDLPARIKNGHIRSCGCLISSSMEKFIQRYLEESGVNYITQYSYDDCINNKGNKLRFDFAIIKNGKVFCLIEYDGKQHYEVVEYFGGQKGFDRRKKYDHIKDDYCKNNNITLLRLPYYLNNNEIKEKIMRILNP